MLSIVPTCGKLRFTELIRPLISVRILAAQVKRHLNQPPHPSFRQHKKKEREQEEIRDAECEHLLCWASGIYGSGW